MLQTHCYYYYYFTDFREKQSHIYIKCSCIFYYKPLYFYSELNLLVTFKEELQT